MTRIDRRRSFGATKWLHRRLRWQIELIFASQPDTAQPSGEQSSALLICVTFNRTTPSQNTRCVHTAAREAFSNPALLASASDILAQLDVEGKDWTGHARVA